MDAIITISRQFGSGGRLIGRMLAEKLGLPFYDREIIDQAAKTSGFAKDFIEDNEQKMKALGSVAMAPPAWLGGIWNNLENFESRIYAAEAEAIEGYAAEGACVIVGRCADSILKDKYPCFNVFIHGHLEDRVQRVLKYYKLENDEKRAAKLILSTDKQRARHYRYYTDAEWGDPNNYHICLDSAAIGIEKSVEILCAAYKLFCESGEGGIE